MKIRNLFQQPNEDPRVKKVSFSKLRFFYVYILLFSLAIGQALMVTNYYDSNVIPPLLLNILLIYWAFVAAIYSFVTTMGIRRKYEKPMQKMSLATKQVAEGNFAISLHPHHKKDKLDYLDVMFLDFNKMVKELASTEILKNDFVSNVSHEIKTPLAVIQNYATLLKGDTLTEEQRKEYTDVIFNAAGQLSVLVTNILRLSKLENQSIQPISQTYDVCRQLSDCIIGYADQLESKQIDFTIETEDIAMVTADESMVEIIWNNLLSNAIKFTEPGGKITVTQTSDEKFVTVSVQDNGCGMNEETMRHIFDKFYQGDTSHLQQGNGLGLALVKKVVDLIGGEITVESKPGKGSIFQVNVCKFENK